VKPTVPNLPPTLVLSLDFELRWGVRDRHALGGPYDANVLGGRRAVPRMLDMFREFDVAATWATVGFLFAESRAELERFAPICRPAYDDPRLLPYGEAIGDGEADDPLHYAPSLIRAIRNTPRQEIGTHTYSHFYCGEGGQTAAAFEADLSAAVAIAASRGISLRSIVLPRNQHNPEYDALLTAAGITAVRGNPRSRAWRFANAAEGTRPWKRAGRLLDSYVNVSGNSAIPWSDIVGPEGLVNLRASRFLRPYSPRLRALEPLRLRRIRESLRAVGRAGSIYHLWWHPHNFGAHTEENLAFLRRVLECYAECRERYGMQSLTMGEVSEVARRAAVPPASTRTLPNGVTG